MNDVHAITARKLRSLATAIRAERYAPHEFGVREAMEAEAVELEKRAAAIEEQVKSAIEEPTEFGSVVRVRREAATTHYFRSYSIPVDEPWCTGNSHWSWPDVIAEATDVEVLRVGIGEADGGEMGGVGWAAGFGLAKHLMYQALRDGRALAITGERQNAYDVMLKFAEEMQP